MPNLEPTKTDILAIGVHPDDVELGCGGTVAKCADQGKSIVICDLTQGELGTRGTPETRLREAEAARKILGAAERINLGMRDGFFENTEANQIRIVEVIRHYQPDVILCNALRDRHPDHGRSAAMVRDAAFLAGLGKLETSREGRKQLPWRPRIVLHYIQDNLSIPHFVVDVSAHWERKMLAIRAFGSQFYNPMSSEPATSISSLDFLNMVNGRGSDYGRFIMCSQAEGFHCERPIGINDLENIL